MSVIIGTVDNDVLNGQQGDDSIYALAGDDTLNGGLGTDTLVGGLGNDRYYVNTPDDVVMEGQSEGFDWVYTSTSYRLPENFERLILESPNGATLIGNNLDNVLHGHRGADIMFGHGGNDIFVGSGGGNVLDGGSGIDSASYFVPRSDYQIIRTGDNLYRVTLSSTGVSDELREIEFAEFHRFGVETPDYYVALTKGGILLSDATPNVGRNLSAVSTLANNQSLKITGYQWQSSDGLGDWANIPLATEANLAPTSAQLGQRLRVRVDFADAVGDGQQAVSEASAPVTLPTNRVFIDGTLIEDHLLTANASEVQGLGPFGYQWFRNDLPIAAATLPTYTLDDADVGKSISVRLDFFDGSDNSAVLISEASTPVINVNDVPFAAMGVNIAEPVTGDWVSVSNLASLVDSDGMDAANYLWQWQSAAYSPWAVPVAWSNLAGATNNGPSANALLVTSALTGKYLRAVLTYTDAGDTSERVVTGSTVVPVSSGVINGVPVDGTSGNDALTGTAANDTLNGLAGNDTLNGGGGADTMRGGSGFDTYFVEHPGDVVIELPGEGTNDVVFSTVTWTLGENIERLALRGEQAISSTGNGLNNTLWADENSAANILRGLVGNDVYYVAAGDTVVEQPGEGTDTVNAHVNFELPAEVENLALVNPSAALLATGNALANTLTGNANANTLRGQGGNDTLSGGVGNDTLDGGTGVDTAVFSGTSSEHTIAFVGGATYTVTRIATGEVDTLVSVERAQFSNTTLTLDTSGVSPNNPPSGADKTITTPEDKPYTITAADFGFSDPADSPPHTLQAVIVTSLPTVGSLSLNEQPVSAAQSVSVADLNAGRLKFSPAPDTNGIGYAGFTFQIRDTGGTASGGVDLDPTPNNITFNVTAVNDEQQLAVNTGATVAENTLGKAISSAMLLTTDADNAPSQMVYQLTQVPAHGTLRLNGLALGQGSSFTQADINATLISYDHSGSESTSDAFQFTVDDSSGSASSGSFAITVTPVNDAPVITSDGGGAAAGLSLAENTSAVTIVTATDPDTPSKDLSYSIFGGADAALFIINNSTGELSFRSAPDFEDSGGTDKVYDVVVGVSDDSLSASQALSITVSDVNEFAVGPVLDIDAADNVLAQSAIVGTVVGITARAVDADGMINTVTYVLTDDAQGRLAIDADSGVVTLADASDLQAHASHDITVRATSADGSTSSQVFTLTVTPPTANLAPVFTGANGFDLFEQTTAVAAITAIDPDNDALSFSLAALDDASLFKIDEASGILSFVTAPDFETPADTDADNVYDLTVQVTDGIPGHLRSLAVSVTVRNANDAPTGGVTIGNMAPVVGQTLVASSTVGDVDGMPGASQFRWQSSGDNGAWNDIDSATGTSYIVPVALAGKRLRLLQSYVDAGGTIEAVPSAATLAIVTPPGINGTAGPDTLQGTVAADVIYGWEGDDSISGAAGNDTLYGGAANDTLDGGASIDTLVGGDGNDTYIVDTTADLIIEGPHGGIDTVRTSVSFSLTATAYANVENVQLTGAANINAYGNPLDNLLTGNAGNNTLDGGHGNDTLIGGAGNDTYMANSTTKTIVEEANAGIDTVQSSVTFSLAAIANVENLRLSGTTSTNATGNALNNMLTGNSGNNLLDGGAGIDTLVGGAGNDMYVVNSTTDVITEAANEGADTVQSSATFSLSAIANVENLTLTGSTSINGTGNTLANTLAGNSGNNLLVGGDGNDSLRGGAGVDSLRGDTGIDVFDFDALSDSGIGLGLRDIVIDFMRGQDRIDLSTIDANINSGAGGDQAFSFIGTAAFSATAQVRYFFDGSNTILEANVGGINANVVDFQIQISGNHTLLATDLIP